MQKKLIALAVAGLGLSGAVFAQSNVTVYGILDETFGSVEATGASNGAAGEVLKRTRLDSNSSYIGFKGTEDLGDGLKAIFQIESGFAADTAGALAGGRDYFVGLSGSNWGTVKLGNLTGPTRALSANVEFSPGWTTNAITSALTGAIAGIGTGTDARLANTVLYISPTFGGGFTAQIGYASGETHTTTTQARNWTAGLDYNNGPLYVAYAYLNRKDPLLAAAQVATLGGGTLLNDELKAHKLGVKYGFDTGTTLAALYDKQTLNVTGSLGSGDIGRKAWMLGVNQKFGQGGMQNVWLQYAKAQKLDGSACSGGKFCDGTDAKQWTLGYSYNLSKRTMIHAFFTEVTNNTNTLGTSYDLAVNPTGLAGVALGKGADPKSYGVGVRHAF